MRNIKIVYLIASSEIGGTERMLLLLAERMGQAGLRPLVVGLKGEGAFTEAVRRAGIPLRVFSLKRNPLAFFSLVALLRRERPDVLHSFLFIANLLGRIAGRLAGVPTIFSGQRSTDEWRRWRHWTLDRLTAPLATAIVSNSYAGKTALMTRGRIAAHRILVIPNGIDAARPVAACSRSDFGAPARLVVTVGNLRTPKGHTYLLDAFPRVLAAFPDTRLVIVGEGPLRSALTRQAARLGMAAGVIFTGYRSDPERIIAAGDVFVLPSLWEGCPVALLEAMACGRAAVGAAVGDVPVIITHGENGLVVPPSDASALAGALLRLLSDEDLRARLGESARRTVREKYSVEAMVAAYRTLYSRHDSIGRA